MNLRLLARIMGCLKSK